jgi:hypothetical protein
MDPYAPPKAELADYEPSGNEATRRSLIAHEVQLKSIGTLYVFVATNAALIGGLAYAAASTAPFPPWTVAALFAVACACGALGFGFRALRPWVRAPGAIAAGLGMIVPPVGTLIGAYVLYLMFCARGRAILAPGYAAIVAATPQVKYRRTIGDWIAIAFVIAIVAALALTLLTQIR